jgi:hypothetical protein
MELTHLVALHFDLDFINLGKDLFAIDQVMKSDPLYDKLYSRDGSLLQLPIATKYAKKFKDQRLRMTHFPSYEALKLSRLQTTSYQRVLFDELVDIKLRYISDYTSLWQNDGLKRVQRHGVLQMGR